MSENIDQKPPEACCYHLAALIYTDADPEPILMTGPEVDRCIERTEKQPEDVPADWWDRLWPARKSPSPDTLDRVAWVPLVVAGFIGAAAGLVAGMLIH